jgi:hypothetical protein|tara:strand:+ start:61 stop:252 length:192 start_codon:yes stop_codon:yes gene_type:complete
MALENVEVLGNLQNQLNQVEEQLNSLTNTRLRLLGAIEVLQQIENSKDETPDDFSETEEVEEE